MEFNETMGKPIPTIDAELYLDEIEVLIKNKDSTEAIALLHRKMIQIQNQIHFNKTDDLMMIDRLCTWIRSRQN